jgi:hypothetical protein
MDIAGGTLTLRLQALSKSGGKCSPERKKNVGHAGVIVRQLSRLYGIGLVRAGLTQSADLYLALFPTQAPLLSVITLST